MIAIRNDITVVDARMGRGKSTAAIRYMNRYKGEKRFLYITPYLDEVDRICEMCSFDQPDDDRVSKSFELKLHMKSGHNISATHALFYLLDEEALGLIRDKHYSLIIDESINTVTKVPITCNDLNILTTQLARVDDSGLVIWTDKGYKGKFEGYMDAAVAKSLYKLDSALLEVFNPEALDAFEEVIMLTYLFDGQYQKAYLDYYGFDYHVVGIERDLDGYYFSDKPDDPPPVNYRSLINIVDSPRMNTPGDAPNALSKNWYARRSYNDKEIRNLRNGMRSFFQDMTDSTSDDRLWTCFKEAQNKLVEKNSGRFRPNFLQISARATNAYIQKTNLAYMANRFIDPNVKKFFLQKGCAVNEDLFALSEMLQWIWRSAIRADKPINLYIPSSRMRNLLVDWINTASEGGVIS